MLADKWQFVIIPMRGPQVMTHLGDRPGAGRQMAACQHTNAWTTSNDSPWRQAWLTDKWQFVIIPMRGPQVMTHLEDRPGADRQMAACHHTNAWTTSTADQRRCLLGHIVQTCHLAGQTSSDQ